MSGDNQYEFPRRINDPLMMLIFPAIQFAPAVMILVICLMFGMWKTGFGGAILVFWGVGKILQNSFFDEYVHKIWRMGLLDVMKVMRKSRTVVNPAIKRYHS
tara:strand:- start:766 stop:1071 length:306 start_codon:yes stop_codon:yes gene_type:complete